MLKKAIFDLLNKGKPKPRHQLKPWQQTSPYRCVVSDGGKRVTCAGSISWKLYTPVSVEREGERVEVERVTSTHVEIISSEWRL